MTTTLNGSLNKPSCKYILNWTQQTSDFDWLIRSCKIVKVYIHYGYSLYVFVQFLCKLKLELALELKGRTLIPMFLKDGGVISLEKEKTKFKKDSKSLN